MPTELYAGTLADFDITDNMAREIENSLEALLGPLPSAPQKLVNDRRVLFIAIANGVINHLKDKEAAVEVTYDRGFGPVLAITEIKVR